MFSAPHILVCGHFDSSVRFGSIPKTRQRVVQCYELELFTAKSGVSVLNHVKYPLDEGCLLLAKPGDLRCSYLHFQSEYIHFSIEEPVLKEVLDAFPGFTVLPEYPLYKARFDKIIHTFFSGHPFDKLAASAELVSLLHVLSRLETEQSPQEDLLERATSFIRRHYAEPITVETVADYCSISQTHLYRIFRTVLSTTPNAYLLEVRLVNSCQLLRETDLSVSEIAMSQGFGTQSYFSERFRKKMGLSPLQYRKQHQYPL